MAFDAVEFYKHHKVAAIGIGVVALLVFYYVYTGSSTPSAQSQAGYSPYNDPNVINAEIAAGQQTAQAQQQANQQVNQINGELALSAQNNANNLAIAQLTQQQNNTQAEYQYYTNLNTTQGQQNIAQIAANTNTTSIGAQKEVQLAQVASNNTIAQLNSEASVSNVASNNAAQQAIARTNAQTQQLISQNQTQVGIAQTNATVEIAKANSSGGIWGKAISAIASVAAVLI